MLGALLLYAELIIELTRAKQPLAQTSLAGPLQEMAAAHHDADVIAVGMGALAVLATLRVALTATGLASQPNDTYEFAEGQWRALVRCASIAVASYSAWRAEGYLLFNAPSLLTGQPPAAVDRYFFCIAEIAAVIALTAAIELRSAATIHRELARSASQQSILSSATKEHFEHLGWLPMDLTHDNFGRDAKTLESWLRTSCPLSLRWPRLFIWVAAALSMVLGLLAELGVVLIRPWGGQHPTLAQAFALSNLWLIPALLIVAAVYWRATDTSDQDPTYGPTSRSVLRWFPRVLGLAGALVLISLVALFWRFSEAQILLLFLSFIGIIPAASLACFLRICPIGKVAVRATRAAALIVALRATERRQQLLLAEAEDLPESATGPRANPGTTASFVGR